MKASPDNKPPFKKVRKICGANFPARRIPPNVLKRTLEILTNPEDGFWINKNTACAPPTSYELYSNARRSITIEKLRLARNCLMQRDYKNLAKILASNLFGDSLLERASFALFSDIASILQKHPKLNAKGAKSQEEPTPPKSPSIEEEAMEALQF
ncbi:uncharacterized protein LOC108029508 [Drosophila biarmipes]|uniref:uncharacterized protein LOC108029508 n=1 Tax=Drosophila biarmipes TaxID=125945 RepID=UPI0007E775CC|nr:uncharacterized protein LOC108029508 [Drosophila biarmipes]